jgi:hypothetical protein
MRACACRTDSPNAITVNALLSGQGGSLPIDDNNKNPRNETVAGEKRLSAGNFLRDNTLTDQRP